MKRHLIITPSSRTAHRCLALGAVAALSLTACGGDDDSTTPDTTAAAADATDTAATGDSQIVISGFAFSGVSEVAVGTTVTVTNEDTASHTWTSTDGAFNSGGLGPGDSFEFTFDEPGTFEYRCNFHTEMTGTIVVTP